MVVAVTLVGFGAFDGSGTAEPDPIPTAAESALLAVEEFAMAWNRGDADVVDGFIAEEWETIVLPALAGPVLRPEDGREALTEAIGFLTSLTSLSLGPCAAEMSPPDSPTTAVVRCDEAVFGGHYLEAVRSSIWHDIAAPAPDPGIVFGVRGDRLLGIATDAGGFAPQAYCIWAEQTRPDAAATLFDLHCRPITAAGQAELHAELAAGFLAAGAPLPSRHLTEARLNALYVDRFVEHHNLQDTYTAQNWLSHTVGATTLPGFAGTGNVEVPSVDDYLSWSATLLQIDAGTCTVEPGTVTTVVDCPGMSVSGPLFDEPLPQPTRFVLSTAHRGGTIARAYGRIVAVEPLADVPVPIEDVCRRLQQTDPTAASLAFDDDCTPVYTGRAADVLATALREE